MVDWWAENKVFVARFGTIVPLPFQETIRRPARCTPIILVSIPVESCSYRKIALPAAVPGLVDDALVTVYGHGPPKTS
jgi:hypothetical protein